MSTNFFFFKKLALITLAIIIWVSGLSPLVCGINMPWLVFIVNLAQPSEVGTSTGEFPQFGLWPCLCGIFLIAK